MKSGICCFKLTAFPPEYFYFFLCFFDFLNLPVFFPDIFPASPELIHLILSFSAMDEFTTCSPFPFRKILPDTLPQLPPYPPALYKALPQSQRAYPPSKDRDSCSYPAVSAPLQLPLPCRLWESAF